MGQLALKEPLLIARNDAVLVLAEADFQENPMTNAQLWRVGSGYSEVQPLGVHLKFLYYLEDVIPPQPWSDPV
ncbi:MAG: hypothetical protein E6R03_14660 [Hyphomicrobiaceae bacterium]|nr:MAG: hypothetical protein E6R03_14660 [Hyphomicrobiaceae bacterium]